jgi:hypothetical protein
MALYHCALRRRTGARQPSGSSIMMSLRGTIVYGWAKIASASD